MNLESSHSFRWHDQCHFFVDRMYSDKINIEYAKMLQSCIYFSQITSHLEILAIVSMEFNERGFNPFMLAFLGNLGCKFDGRTFKFYMIAAPVKYMRFPPHGLLVGSRTMKNNSNFYGHARPSCKFLLTLGFYKYKFGKKFGSTFI